MPWSDEVLHPRLLRTVLGCYPTGVAIVATRSADGRPVGLTINSFASLSLEPPLVLWSLVNRSPSLQAFRDCTHFTISVLGCSQEALARHFANPAVPDKFDGIAVMEAPEGVPAIAGAAATLVCASDHHRETGDHHLLVGRVLRVARSETAPLVFHGGRFTGLAA
nr:flavin reductase family protein [uncultured Pseudacidovorax sp.]